MMLRWGGREGKGWGGHEHRKGREVTVLSHAPAQRFDSKACMISQCA